MTDKKLQLLKFLRLTLRVVEKNLGLIIDHPKLSVTSPDEDLIFIQETINEYLKEDKNGSI